MNIQNSNLTNGVSFSGHKKQLDKKGEIQHSFYYLYDSNKYSCEVELYNIDNDEKGNIQILGDKETPVKKYELPEDGKLDINIPKEIHTNNTLGFAYRFKLTEKNRYGEPIPEKVSYAFDNGDVIGIQDKGNRNNKYNIIFNNRAIINKNGPMQLIMPDEYYPGVEKGQDSKPTVNDGLRAKALTSVRTHANKLGGNLYGIISRLPEIKKEGISRIVGTPFTKDTVSSHLYWTENAYQVAPDLGNEEDFKELQRQLFSNGINWIADAALVNEGLGGVHISSVLRNGMTSYAQNMFRGSEQKALGILPAKSDDPKDVTTQHTKMKIMNAPFIVENSKIKSNPKFDSKKPTFIQFYDDRLASKQQILSDSPSAMKTYENKNTDSIYDITKHDDAVYPFALEVDPDALLRNVRRTMFRNKGNFSDSRSIPYEDIKSVANFSNFKVVDKGGAGGLELWDGNVDIAKLNFFMNPADFGTLSEEEVDNFQRGTLAVKDYAINSGKYWTKLTADTQLEFIADKLSKSAQNAEGYQNTINSLANSNLFPEAAKEIDQETIQNVLDGNYHLRRIQDADTRSNLNPEISKYNGKELKKNDYTTGDYILKKALDTPLETLPLATNLMGIVTSPYMTQKPIVKEELGLSKYDLTRIREQKPDEKYDKTTSQVTNIYENNIVPIVNNLVSGIPGISDNGQVSEYGRYVLSEIVPDLTRYVLTKAIAPNADIKVSDDGHFDFTQVDEESITMQSLGLKYKSGKTEAEEAQVVIDKINAGLGKLSEAELGAIKHKVEARFSERTLNDYRVAEMLHDRTESGLGWRIDAAKDVASIDAVRSNNDTILNAWDNVIDFWKTYNQSVLQENPHAYTTAEITDLANFLGYNEEDRYMCSADAERKFLEQTGITSVANYNYFFSLLPALFTKYNFEDGGDTWSAKDERTNEIRNKLSQGWTWSNPETGEGDDNPGFLFQSPEDGVINSYTFVGNHDKPRLLHGLTMDMSLFHGGLHSKEHQTIADKVLQTTNLDYDKLDSKAIAMGYRIDTAIDAVVKNDNTLNDELKEAVSHLAQGKYKGTEFDAEAFGTRPIEVAIKTVFDEVEYQKGAQLPNRKDLEAKLLNNIMEPAFDKFLSIYKLLITIPGSPTDFAGDRVGLTGYESKAKNYHQQNRNIIPWEYLQDGEENKYQFVKKFYNKMNEIANIRSMKELSALNDGATVVLPIANEKGETSNYFQSMLRYNDKGSVVITLHNNVGANVSNTEKMNRRDANLSKEKDQINEKIVLNPDIATVKEGLPHGLEVGTEFKSTRPGDNSTYKIATTTIKGKEYYYIKRIAKNGHELGVQIKPEDLNTLILYKV